ncbi:thiamine pyrophosphate-binding protein [Streptomyces sp. NPDC058695]|uniref:thiamine pyrophosphate-binding protein n=1 Tax=Streptomyces sp. NPDC058695 TaxID=3346604 RepID=UPI003657775C
MDVALGAPSRSRIARGPLEVTVSDVFSGILRHHGVEAVSGNPGSDELSFLAGRPDGIPYYLVLQEGAAIGIADGFAQASDTIGLEPAMRGAA